MASFHLWNALFPGPLQLTSDAHNNNNLEWGEDETTAQLSINFTEEAEGGGAAGVGDEYTAFPQSIGSGMQQVGDSANKFLDNLENIHDKLWEEDSHGRNPIKNALDGVAVAFENVSDYIYGDGSSKPSLRDKSKFRRYKRRSGKHASSSYEDDDERDDHNDDRRRRRSGNGRQTSSERRSRSRRRNRRSNHDEDDKGSYHISHNFNPKRTSKKKTKTIIHYSKGSNRHSGIYESKSREDQHDDDDNDRKERSFQNVHSNEETQQHPTENEHDDDNDEGKEMTYESGRNLQVPSNEETQEHHVDNSLAHDESRDDDRGDDFGSSKGKQQQPQVSKEQQDMEKDEVDTLDQLLANSDEVDNINAERLENVYQKTILSPEEERRNKDVLNPKFLMESVERVRQRDMTSGFHKVDPFLAEPGSYKEVIPQEESSGPCSDSKSPSVVKRAEEPSFKFEMPQPVTPKAIQTTQHEKHPTDEGRVDQSIENPLGYEPELLEYLVRSDQSDTESNIVYVQKGSEEVALSSPVFSKGDSYGPLDSLLRSIQSDGEQNETRAPKGSEEKLSSRVRSKDGSLDSSLEKVKQGENAGGEEIQADHAKNDAVAHLHECNQEVSRALEARFHQLDVVLSEIAEARLASLPAAAAARDSTLKPNQNKGEKKTSGGAAESKRTLEELLALRQRVHELRSKYRGTPDERGERHRDVAQGSSDLHHPLDCVEAPNIPLEVTTKKRGKSASKRSSTMSTISRPSDVKFNHPMEVTTKKRDKSASKRLGTMSTISRPSDVKLNQEDMLMPQYKDEKDIILDVILSSFSSHTSDDETDIDLPARPGSPPSRSECMGNVDTNNIVQSSPQIVEDGIVEKEIVEEEEIVREEIVEDNEDPKLYETPVASSVKSVCETTRDKSLGMGEKTPQTASTIGDRDSITTNNSPEEKIRADAILKRDKWIRRRARGRAFAAHRLRSKTTFDQQWETYNEEAPDLIESLEDENVQVASMPTSDESRVKEEENDCVQENTEKNEICKTDTRGPQNFRERARAFAAWRDMDRAKKLWSERLQNIGPHEGSTLIEDGDDASFYLEESKYRIDAEEVNEFIQQNPDSTLPDEEEEVDNLESGDAGRSSPDLAEILSLVDQKSIDELADVDPYYENSSSNEANDDQSSSEKLMAILFGDQNSMIFSQNGALPPQSNDNGQGRQIASLLRCERPEEMPAHTIDDGHADELNSMGADDQNDFDEMLDILYRDYHSLDSMVFSEHDETLPQLNEDDEAGQNPFSCLDRQNEIFPSKLRPHLNEDDQPRHNPLFSYERPKEIPGKPVHNIRAEKTRSKQDSYYSLTKRASEYNSRRETIEGIERWMGFNERREDFANVTRPDYNSRETAREHDRYFDPCSPRNMPRAPKNARGRKKNISFANLPPPINADEAYEAKLRTDSDNHQSNTYVAEQWGRGRRVGQHHVYHRARIDLDDSVSGASEAATVAAICGDETPNQDHHDYDKILLTNHGLASLPPSEIVISK